MNKSSHGWERIPKSHTLPSLFLLSSSLPLSGVYLTASWNLPPVALEWVPMRWMSGPVQQDGGWLERKNDKNKQLGTILSRGKQKAASLHPEVEHPGLLLDS
jgi:hypothetical protein